MKKLLSYKNIFILIVSVITFGCSNTGKWVNYYIKKGQRFSLEEKDYGCEIVLRATHDGEYQLCPPGLDYIRICRVEDSESYIIIPIGKVCIAQGH